MPKYFYKGQEVELVPGQQFSTHWNVYYNEPTQDGGSKRRIATGVLGVTLTEVPDAIPMETPATKTIPDESKPLNINTATFSAIRSRFPGIGRVAPKSIVTNRPEGGYKDFEELKEINKSLTINWEQLEKELVFE